MPTKTITVTGDPGLDDIQDIVHMYRNEEKGDFEVAVPRLSYEAILRHPDVTKSMVFLVTYIEEGMKLWGIKILPYDV
jgi:hypothetical protein